MINERGRDYNVSAPFFAVKMQVTITYHDTDSLTVEEIVKNAQHSYGKYVDVKVMPESTNPHDLIAFGLQAIITHEQISLLFDKTANYQVDIASLRASTLRKVGELLDQVIIDNESRVAR